MKTNTPGLIAFAVVCLPALGESQGAEVMKAGDKVVRQRSIEEVVVTAQKREERLQDVPISISVLGGEQLDSLATSGLLHALARTPGVAIKESVQGGTTTLGIRGVNATAALFSGTSPIGFYMDSLPFGFVRSALVPDIDPYDLDRVEVLSGPQGTLYGASSLNGVVRVLTREADLSKFDAKAIASIGSTKKGGTNYSGDMAINVPLIEGKLAVRGVAGYESRSGWIDSPNRKDVNDAEIKNFRLKLEAQPTEDLSIALSTWRSRTDAGSPPVSNDQDEKTYDDLESNDVDFDTHSLNVIYRLPALEISSATSYLKFTNVSTLALVPFGVPSGAAPFDTDIRAKNFSEELLLNSSGDGVWSWSGGVFYREAQEDLYQIFAGSDATYKSRSHAIFGQLTRSLLDKRLDVSIGLRYFEDRVTYRDNPGEINPGPFFYESEGTFHNVSPKATVTWRTRTGNNIYASYGEGFRSGYSQFSTVTRLSPEFAPVGPDELKNYEVGTKGRFADNRIEYHVAVFYIDWKDIQQVVNVRDDNSASTFPAAINSGSASGAGAEIALTVRPIPLLEFGVNGSWNDVALDDPVSSGGQVLFDKGFRPLGSVEYTVGGFAGYSAPIRSDWLVRFETSGQYTAPTTEVTVTPGGGRDIQSGDPILLVGASLSLETPEHWTITAFVDNLTNNRNVPSRSFGVPEWTTRLRPMTIGLKFGYAF